MWHWSQTEENKQVSLAVDQQYSQMRSSFFSHAGIRSNTHHWLFVLYDERMRIQQWSTVSATHLIFMFSFLCSCTGGDRGIQIGSFLEPFLSCLSQIRPRDSLFSTPVDNGWIVFWSVLFSFRDCLDGGGICVDSFVDNRIRKLDHFLLCSPVR